MHVEKSLRIAVPPEKVFESLRDFRQWRSWSPWVIAEPDCALSYAEDGRSYSWDGKIIGAGELVLTSEDPPYALDYGLSFFKPWKSQSRTRFALRADGDGTMVTWTMDGSLPAFLFWMKAQMEIYVGMDYQRGLTMLKDELETGVVPSRLEFPGEEDYAARSFVGSRHKCEVAEIGAAMASAFEKLHAEIGAGGTSPSGPPFSIYHNWDPVKGNAEFTAAIPVESPPQSLPSGVMSGELPAGRAYLVRHTGAYPHLGNAWASGLMHGRAKQFAQDKKTAPFEVYLNDPRETPEAELVTVVHFPVKG